MSEQPSNSGEKTKTIAIRVAPELRGRLASVLSITGHSVNDAGAEALEDWMAKKLSDPKVRERALASLDDDERDLKARRQTLQGLIGEGDTAPEKSSSRRGSKS